MTTDSAERSGRSTPLVALVAAVVGFVLAAILFFVVGGNPFSDTNQVVYRDIVVGAVSAAEDSLCWSEDPEQRDAPQECAILTLDPEVDPPEQGEEVTIGLLELRPPDGEAHQQIVYVAPAQADVAPPEGDGTPPASDDETS